MVAFITAWCLSCGAPRYKSLRPLEDNETISPTLFRPAEPGIGPPPQEGAAVCPVCNDPLRFTRDAEKTETITNTPPRPDFSTLGVAATEPGSVAEIFRVADGEELLKVKVQDDPDRLLIVTTKRVVVIR